MKVKQSKTEFLKLSEPKLLSIVAGDRLKTKLDANSQTAIKFPGSQSTKEHTAP